MVKRKTSIDIDDETWKRAKKRAIDLDKPVSDYLTDLINKDTRTK